MTRIEIKSRVGPDGVLNLTVPVGPEEANREVVVTVVSTKPTELRNDWQAFLDRTYGSCAGLGLEVPPDLPLQSRDW